jgi:hypothetical protein
MRAACSAALAATSRISAKQLYGNFIEGVLSWLDPNANLPIGPVGRPTELQLMLNTYAYGYTLFHERLENSSGEQYSSEFSMVSRLVRCCASRWLARFASRVQRPVQEAVEGAHHGSVVIARIFPEEAFSDERG